MRDIREAFARGFTGQGATVFASNRHQFVTQTLHFGLQQVELAESRLKQCFEFPFLAGPQVTIVRAARLQYRQLSRQGADGCDNFIIRVRSVRGNYRRVARLLQFVELNFKPFKSRDVFGHPVCTSFRNIFRLRSLLRFHNLVDKQFQFDRPHL